MLRIARAAMSNHTFDDLDGMMNDNDFPALEQALNEGADVNMVDDGQIYGVDSPNLAVD